MQSIKNNDNFMTIAEFAGRTGIHPNSTISELRDAFDDAGGVNQVLSMPQIDPSALKYASYILRDADLDFVKKLFQVKHLLTDRNMIALQRATESYVVYFQQRMCLEPRSGSQMSKYEPVYPSRYHNVSVAYRRICQAEIDTATKVIKRALLYLPLDCADGLIEQLRRDNIWQPRKGLAVVEASVKQWWPKYKNDCKERTVRITHCELVLVNRRLLKGVCRWL